MLRIGILSDTHGYLDKRIIEFFSDADQIWHAGDIGSSELTEQIKKQKQLVAVYGNIDDHRIRLQYPEFRIFEAEGMKVLMKHIGGYPGHYNQDMLKLIQTYRPGLVICGHSHILRIFWDKQLSHLHINPGAAGKNGIHQVITAVRLVIDNGKMKDLEIFEAPRNKVSSSDPSPYCP